MQGDEGGRVLIQHPGKKAWWLSWARMGVGVGDVEGRMALILLVELGGKS